MLSNNSRAPNADAAHRRNSVAWPSGFRQTTTVEREHKADIGSIACRNGPSWLDIEGSSKKGRALHNPKRFPVLLEAVCPALNIDVNQCTAIRNDAMTAADQRGDAMVKDPNLNRAENVSQPDSMPAELNAIRKKQIEGLVAMQTELIKRFQEANQSWFERVQSEANLASDLAVKLTEARSIPETTTAFQEWTSRHNEMAAGDAKRILAEGQKFMETGTHLLSKVWLPNRAGVGSS
jgi:hypothetical protein